MTATDAGPVPGGEADMAGAAAEVGPQGPREPADLIGLLAVAGAGLLPVVLIDDLYWGTWAPKAALCLVLLFPGLVMLAGLVVAGSRPARFATTFLAAAGVSTALADKPALSLVGAANWGTGLLFVATLVGAWALGVSIADRRRRQLVMAIIAAVIVNAAVAWAQAQVGVGGRSRGLMGNPVYLGGLAAGGLFLLGRRFGRERRSWWWLPAVAGVAGAAQLSGGRAAVALAAAAALASLRGAGAARGAALAAAVVIGVLLAPVGADGPVTLGSTRAAPASVVSTSDTRFAVWRISMGAVGERPLVGWGPGRFAAATTPRYDAVAAQEGLVLKDAHNWVVEYAVTTGLVGLALLLAWLGAAAWGARGPLAGFALVVGASSLVQPQHVALTPMAMLALGAAGAGRGLRDGVGGREGGGLGRRWGAAAGVGLGIGLVGAGILLVGQHYLQRGVEDDSLRDMRRAIALSPPWPEVALRAASVEASYGLSEGEPHKRRTLELARQAVRRDPSDSSSWAEMGALELEWGSNERAATAFREALEANPWDVASLLGRVTLAGRQGDRASLAESCRRLRTLGGAPKACPAAGRDASARQ